MSQWLRCDARMSFGEWVEGPHKSCRGGGRRHEPWRMGESGRARANPRPTKTKPSVDMAPRGQEVSSRDEALRPPRASYKCKSKWGNGQGKALSHHITRMRLFAHPVDIHPPAALAPLAQFDSASLA